MHIGAGLVAEQAVAAAQEDGENRKAPDEGVDVAADARQELVVFVDAKFFAGARYGFACE